MDTITSYLVSSAYSSITPVLNSAAVCAVNGQNVACPTFGVFGALFPIVILVLLALNIVGMWKVFTKAGQPGWASIVPIYNMVVLLTIVKKPIWWIVLFFIPLVNIIMSIIVMHELSKAFGKGIGFTVGLLFLPFIFYPILGLGKATYMGAPSPSEPLSPVTPAAPVI